MTFEVPRAVSPSATPTRHRQEHQNDHRTARLVDHRATADQRGEPVSQSPAERSAAVPTPDTSPRTLWSVARETIDDFFEESPFQLAGALSFYTLLSLSPLVLVVVGV